MVFDPKNGQWMVWWIQWQTFLPILLLQFVNLLWVSLDSRCIGADRVNSWYYLIWRVIYK